jgi:hypothetical protein
LSIGQRQQQLLGSIGGLRVAGNGRRPKLKRLGQVRPHRFRQIAHVGPVGRSALEQPTAHLRSPISRLAMLGHPSFQINGGIEDVGHSTIVRDSPQRSDGPKSPFAPRKSGNVRLGSPARTRFRGAKGD